MVVAEREEREEELLDPLTPPPLVVREAGCLIVVPFSVPESSLLLVGLVISTLEEPPLVEPDTLPAEGRAEEPTVAPPRKEELVPPAICVPPREPSLSPNCWRYEGREEPPFGNMVP